MAGGGGPRKNAGRKKGQINRLNREAIEEAKKLGILPHEWLLAVARGDPIEQRRWETQFDAHGKESGRVMVTEIIYPEFSVRIDAAKAAAPFFAPRLATQTVSVKGGNESVAEALKLVADKLPV